MRAKTLEEREAALADAEQELDCVAELWLERRAGGGAPPALDAALTEAIAARRRAERYLRLARDRTT